MNFVSDNVTGAAPRVLEALAALGESADAAYGTDAESNAAARRIADLFEAPEAVVFLVATGTAANALALAALTPPWGAVLCHEEAHVNDDECGAPEFFTHGAKLAGIPGAAGKIDPASFRHALTRFPKAVKSVQPAVLSLSQVTEAGTLYTLAEIAALSAAAKDAGLKVHLDGARFANALVALGCTPADMSWKAGADVVTLGLTKVGGLACEAIVVFDPVLAETLPYRRKRGGHTLSKGRLLGAQANALLADGYWLDLARHANATARRLADGLAALPGVRLAWPAEANEVFPILPAAMDARLRAAGFAFLPWATGSLMPGDTIGADERLVRMVTSWATRPDTVERLLSVAAQA